MMYSAQNRSTFRASIVVAALLTVSVLPSCGHTPVPDKIKSANSNLVTNELKTIWADARIGTDSKYQKSFRAEAKQKAIAPEDMRSFITSWIGDRSIRKWPQELNFFCKDKRVGVMWSAEIPNQHDANKAIDLFEGEMNERGYQQIEDVEAIKDLARQVGVEKSKIDRMPWSMKQAYERKVGETRIVVFAGAASYDGGGPANRSGLKCQWYALREWPHEPPTFSQTLAALPKWCKAPWLNDSIYESVADQKIVSLRTGNGFTVNFLKSVDATIVKSLEASDFVFHGERESSDPVQKTWYRYSDTTYAHVITFPNSEQVRFSCQTPQNTGPPKTGPAPVRHPSLRLPISKRPVVELDQLEFANEAIKQKTQRFQDLAESIAGKAWFVQRYKDVRNSSKPKFRGRWMSAEVESSYVLERDRPFQSVEITLSQTSEDSKADQLDSLSVKGRWVPREGWAAFVNTNGDVWSATVDFVKEHDGRLGFSSRSNKDRIFLTSDSVTATAKSGQTYYEYQVRLPYGVTPEDQAKRKQKARRLLASPESLRDVLLEDLAALRLLAGSDDNLSKHVKAEDWSNVRSDSPPRPIFSSLEAKTRVELIDSASKAIEHHEDLVRKHFEEMHAAIKKAVPIDTLE